MARGNRDVVLSVTRNEGARFSDTSFRTLVDKSIDDEVLAICVGMRKDIPRAHFKTLISKASAVVLEKLTADKTAAVAEVRQVLTGITGQEVVGLPGPEHAQAAPRPAKSADAAVYELATSGNFAETIVALSALSRTPKELVENVLSDRRGDNDITLLLAKAAGLSWPTAMQICIMRRGPNGLPPMAIEAARKDFERLQADTAQRVIGFYEKRRAAVGNFERLAQSIGHDG